MRNIFTSGLGSATVARSMVLVGVCALAASAGTVGGNTGVGPNRNGSLVYVNDGVNTGFDNKFGTTTTANATVTDSDSFASAFALLGTNGASVSSGPLGPAAYAASVWADTITITGGTGVAPVHMDFSLTGSITGDAAVRYRFSISTPIGNLPFDSSTTASAFGTTPYPDQGGVFDLLFDGTTFGPITAPGSYGFGAGVSTGLDYNTPYVIQLFLEAYTPGNGSADFLDPGHFDVIDIPFNASIIFGSGNPDAPVENVPEPAAGLLAMLGLGAVQMLRRRIA